MVRSRLPVPSLLGLFGALLMLSPELLLGVPKGYSDVPVTDPRVQRGLAFSLRTFNQDKVDSTNYFKVLAVLQAQLKVEYGRVRDYLLRVQLVETTCKKKTNEVTKTYKQIQECQPLLGNPKKLKVKFTLHRSE